MTDDTPITSAAQALQEMHRRLWQPYCDAKQGSRAEEVLNNALADCDDLAYRIAPDALRTLAAQITERRALWMRNYEDAVDIRARINECDAVLSLIASLDTGDAPAPAPAASGEFPDYPGTTMRTQADGTVRVVSWPATPTVAPDAAAVVAAARKLLDGRVTFTVASPYERDQVATVEAFRLRRLHDALAAHHAARKDAPHAVPDGTGATEGAGEAAMPPRTTEAQGGGAALKLVGVGDVPPPTPAPFISYMYRGFLDPSSVRFFTSDSTAPYPAIREAAASTALDGDTQTVDESDDEYSDDTAEQFAALKRCAGKMRDAWDARENAIYWLNKARSDHDHEGATAQVGRAESALHEAMCVLGPVLISLDVLPPPASADDEPDTFGLPAMQAMGHAAPEAADELTYDPLPLWLNATDVRRIVDARLADVAPLELPDLARFVVFTLQAWETGRRLRFPFDADKIAADFAACGERDDGEGAGHGDTP